MSAERGRIRVERKGRRAEIVIDRREARNALTWAMYDMLDDAITDLAGDNHTRVIVLRGAGHTFSAGTDIAQFQTFQSAQDGIVYERRIAAVVTRLARVPVPVIALVEGIAAGAGMLLCAACDLRVCTPDARFGAPIARTLGNALSLDSTRRLIALLGAARVRSLLLTASLMDASEAHACGFVAAVVPPMEMEAHVDALSERLMAHAPITMEVTKAMMERILEGISDDEDLLGRVYGSADFAEGVRAFREKRPPNWEGR